MIYPIDQEDVIMNENSVLIVRDWVYHHRQAVKPHAPRAVKIAEMVHLESSSVLSLEDLHAGWSEIADAIVALDAPAQVKAGVQDLLSGLDAGGVGQSLGKIDSGPHALSTAPAGGAAPISPLFWRGCAFGALAAVSSGVGAGGALLACVLVGVLAD